MRGVDFFFLPVDIIILTARRKEANNYVTQKTISPPRLGHFLVLPVLPLGPAPPRSPAPAPHGCLLDGVGKLPLRKLSACLFPVIPERSKKMH